LGVFQDNKGWESVLLRLRPRWRGGRVAGRVAFGKGWMMSSVMASGKHKASHELYSTTAC
jgi:hypothetical protein